MKSKALIPQEVIQNKILLLRGKKVMLDRDLAALYGVTTYALKRAVRRKGNLRPKGKVTAKAGRKHCRKAQQDKSAD